MWYDESVIYQIYPLGLCDSLRRRPSEDHSLLRILDWIDHIKKLGATAVLFNPLMESDYHGYDTRDYLTVDSRLGTQEDLKTVCDAIHQAGMKILFDGVFNHVGRGFWAFQDVIHKKWDSPYCSWFHISFDGNTAYNDGFWYESWEGHYELVKLNLENPEVRNYLCDVIRNWIRDYQIDGLRLDVAYCLKDWYLRELRQFANGAKEDFVLIGETLHGDYNLWMGDDKCHAVTNYECYKGLYSSFNSANMHEISFSLNRQFGYENWCIYRGKHLLSFVDNHDVERIASILNDKNHIPVIYGLIFGMPGVPSIYYGSEWGLTGRKSEGDEVLRPSIEKPSWNTLTDTISQYASIKTSHKALCYGGYRNLHIMPKQLVFERAYEDERILCLYNADGNPYFAPFYADSDHATDLMTGEAVSIQGGYEIPAYGTLFLKLH